MSIQSILNLLIMLQSVVCVCLLILALSVSNDK